ncbi:Mbov_0397 family ICE element conjugal transfer ATPase [Mycoplasma putrefaciens]|uniref:TraE/TrsE family NTPase n=1 Tax=Mycoplasma putrefaciens Mput9231 TaxID=1292033 RepID=M9WC25_9MOLU|nr:DUF87 domain-containing protein [Mycoplasma putrefaciens]AGJ90712.1 TraE/TrsE family NTPase [Mycoplasma putrefaciens Mput9231]
MSKNVNIIPKRFSSNKIKLFLGFSIFETFIWVVLSVLSALLINHLANRIGQKIIFSITVILLIGSLFIEIKGQKIWKLLFYFLTFKFSKKTYYEEYATVNEELDTEQKDDLEIVPFDKTISLTTSLYKRLEEDFLVTKNGWYITGFELLGLNLELFSDEKQDEIIERLAHLFRQIELKYSLVSLPSVLDFQNNIKYLKRKKENIKNALKIEQIDDYIDQLSNFEATEIKKFYITFYSQSTRELKQAIEYLKQKFNSIGFSPRFLDRYKLVNLVKNILNPFKLENYTAQQIDDFENNIGLLLTFPKIKFKSNCMIASSDKEKLYLGFQTMSKYRDIPQFCWLAPYTGTNDTMIINVSPLDLKRAESDISRALYKNLANQSILSKKKVITDRKIDGNLEIYKELIDQVALGEEKLRSIDINFISYGRSKLELLSNLKLSRTIAKEKGFEVNSLTFQQQKGYKNAILTEERPLYIDFAQEIPCSTLAQSFPFISSNLNDTKGLPLGLTSNLEPLVLDQFKHFTQDKLRQSFSGLVLGTTGSGKSTLLNKILLFSISLDKKLIIFDVESEYKRLTEKFGGKWINLSNGKVNRINPLQPFGVWVQPIEEHINQDDQTITATNPTNDIQLDTKQSHELDSSDDEEILFESKNSILQSHKDFFINWIEILYPELTKEERLIIGNELFDLYMESDFYKKPIQQWENTDFPTFDDLYKKLELLSEKEIAKEIKSKILLFMQEFTGYGSYASLWNGHTTIDLSNNLITLDCKNLYDKIDRKLINAQTILTTCYIKNYIDVNWQTLEEEIFKLNKQINNLEQQNKKDSRIKNLKKQIVELSDRKQTIVVFDEGHKFIDSKNPVALNFISDLIKRGRKRRVSTLISTQNPTDFWDTIEVRKKTEAILGNMQYLFVGKLDSKDIGTIDEMFKEYGGLTDNEKQFLKFADTFEYLFAIAKLEKFTFKLNLTKKEKENINFSVHEFQDENELFKDD